jgi:hypothetical protein
VIDVIKTGALDLLLGWRAESSSRRSFLVETTNSGIRIDLTEKYPLREGYWSISVVVTWSKLETADFDILLSTARRCVKDLDGASKL